MFISSDMRERSRYFDDVVGELSTNLENLPNFADRHGRIGAKLLGLLDNTYLANMRHGQVYVPYSKRDTDDVPVALIRPNEKLTRKGDFTSMTPTQRMRVGQQLSGWLLPGIRHDFPSNVSAPFEGCIQDLYSRVRSDPDPICFADKPGVLGKCGPAANSVGLSPLLFEVPGEDNTVLVGGRPIVTLLMTPEVRSDAPATLLHELKHAQQVLEYPLRLRGPDQRIHRELEAYHTAGMYELALRHEGLAPYAGPNAIPADNFDTFAAAHGGTIPEHDPYAPTPQVKQNIHNAGLIL